MTAGPRAGGFGRNDVWIVGHKVILHWDGSLWRTTAREESLSAIWGAAPNDVWAAGSRVLRWSGVSWNAFARSGSAVFGTAANDVWVLDDWDEASHFDGLSLSRASIEGEKPPVCLSALTGSRGTLLAGGCGGALYRLKGGKWHPLSRGVMGLRSSQDFNVLAATPTGVFAGGHTSLFADGPSTVSVLGRTSTGWIASFARTLPWWAGRATMQSLSALSDTEAWALSAGEQEVFRLQGDRWTTSRRPGSKRLTAVKAFSSSDVWMVGDDGSVYHAGGGGWAPVAHPLSGTTVDFHCIDGRPDDFWVGGTKGTLLRYRATGFAPEPSGVDQEITDLSAPTPSFALAAGAFGLRAWDGKTWGSTGLSEWVRAVHAASPTEAWAEVKGRELRAWDGSSWSPVRSVNVTLGEIGLADVQSAAGVVYVLGKNGEVLARGGSR